MRISYAYIRVSTEHQKVDRQLKLIKEYRPEIKEQNIFIDKMSGKDADRPNYINLKNTMDIALNTIENLGTQCEIEIIVSELDRLGRNKKQVLEDIEDFRKKGITLRVLNIPTTLAEIDETNKWVMEIANKMIIEVYAAVAEQELITIKERQQAGIEIAKAEGKYKGRKPMELTDTIKEVLDCVIKHRMTVSAAARELDLSRQTIYNLLDKYKELKKEKNQIIV